MQATTQWGPLLTLVVPRQRDQVVACAGEESTEAEYQARREAVNVGKFSAAGALDEQLIVPATALTQDPHKAQE